MISVPAVIFSMAFSPGIIYLVGGYEYTGSIVPMMIMMPQIFIIGYEQILVVQVLLPMSSDRITLFNSIVGASVATVLNLLLVRQWGAVGLGLGMDYVGVVGACVRPVFRDAQGAHTFPGTTAYQKYRRLFPLYTRGLLCHALHCGRSYSADVYWGAVMTAYFVAIQKYVLKSPVFVDLYNKSLSFS